jgi:hypothetical protein
MLRLLLRPIDFAWLAVFRALFGVSLCISMLRFIGYGWIDRLFVVPTLHFKYWGFEWVQPLSPAQMHVLFWALAALALCMALGLFYRVTSLAFAVGLTYIQLIDVSTYLNHYYLAALLAWLLSVAPAHRAWSVDAWLGRLRTNKGPASVTIPAAWLYLFRVQVGVVYFFAGLAKANRDWLLHGQPLSIWLGTSVDLPIIGPLFTLPYVPLTLSWCAFLFDTTIVGWLLYPRTRPWAYAVVIAFHTMTRVLFPIGMFSAIMVGAALVFFSPSWPRWARVFLRRLQSQPSRPFRTDLAPTPAPEAHPARGRPGTSWQKLGLAAGAVYVLVQVALPLRFVAYGGNVLWHEQGMRFSWRVMLRAKGGSTTFLVRNKATGQITHVSPRDYLTGMQEDEMSNQPDLILQLAHHIHEDFERRGLGPVEVRAESYAALNGRRRAPFIDPQVDLVAVRDGLGRADWVLPEPTQMPQRTRPVR